MDRAIIPESIGGRGKRAAAVLLAFIVLVAVLQPCFAASPLRSPCCRSHASKCHDSALARFCAMNTATGAPPEEMRQAVRPSAEIPPPAAIAVLSALAMREANDPTWLRDQRRCFLLNSVLLI
jgi:hypothetical protein